MSKEATSVSLIFHIKFSYKIIYLFYFYIRLYILQNRKIIDEIIA